MAQSDVYFPKSVQLWKAVMNWLAFLVQIFVHIFRATPSLTQVFSYIGFAQGPFLSTSSGGFKPLPVVETPLHPRPLSAASAAVDVFAEDGRVSGDADVACAADSDGRLDKFTVVLDLDETLVCAYETSSLPAVIISQAAEARLNWFELECLSTDKECEGEMKINYITVFERPGLHEFLKQLSEFADLVLFTAGLEGYARPLVDRIDSENRFSRRLYRPSTVSTEYRDHVKDLSHVSKDLCRVVIVDNNPFSFLLQPLNGIPCVPFSAGQPQDDQLLEVILPLLKELCQEKDVRPLLYEKFHMPEWFQKQGIPASFWPL